jgi:hypothetical protein
MEKFGLLFIFNVILLVETFGYARIYLVCSIFASFDVDCEIVSMELAIADDTVFITGLLDGNGLFVVWLIHNQQIHSDDLK